ncbi:MAG TPA: RNA 2',3'-cyclic phosphodiesterase [Candidatus Limnocylindria bacterium]
MRLFVAVDVPSVVASTASQVLPEIPSFRRVRPDLMHVTLVFLGAVPDEQLDEVAGAVREAVTGRRAFRVSFETLGRFPPGGAPTVAWLGIGRGATEMTALAESVRRRLEAHALPFDPNPFRPHLTLGRVREGAGRDEVRAIAGAVERGRVPPLAFTVGEVSVVESALSSKGPRYTARAVVPLVPMLGGPG